MSAQRIRLRFRKGTRVRYLSHLDVLRYWERCLRRAELPLSYSQGFTPHPKLQFAGPLPLGFAAESEIVDITLDERVTLETFVERLAAQTTDELSVVTVEEVAVSGPAPQSVAAWADYVVLVEGVDIAEAESAVRAFSEASEWPYLDDRRDRPRTIDLVALTAGLSCREAEGGVELLMRLSAHQDATARPEMLVASLLPGREAGLITRLSIELDERSAAHDAWRRVGRFDD
ncbi:MAG: TIGR03936 family radical SAM-associated protein [Dehalococcoidia bacterium]